MKQVASNIMKGISIVAISLPVRIFEPRSAIQRIADLWSFGPIFLNQAAQSNDHLERLKLVVVYLISGAYMGCKQLKPFNPLLGETLQGHFEDGTQLYCEHTSHHPPISNFSIEGKDDLYHMYGHYEYVAKMGTNTLTTKLQGPNNIIFKDGHHIRFGMIDFKIGGTVMGDRTIESVGSVVFEDLTNNRKAVIITNTHKAGGFFSKKESGRKDEITGIIYECEKI